MAICDRKAIKERIRQRISQKSIAAPTAVLPFIDGREFVRIAAYIRTNEAAEAGSVELLCNYYESLIAAQPNCNLVGIYVDCRNRPPQFTSLIDDCLAGKIDLIITKNINRMCANVVDCIHLACTLANLNPPVGIYFEAEDLYTLSAIAKPVIDMSQSQNDDNESKLQFSAVMQALSPNHNFDYLPYRAFQEKGNRE